MIVRLANENDCKAVWTWLSDQMFTNFTSTASELNYPKYQRWFKITSNQNAIVIGVRDNLRIGMAMTTSIQGELFTSFLIKPAYCGRLGDDFIHKSCAFISHANNRDLYVNVANSEISEVQLAGLGFEKVKNAIFVFRRP